LHSAKGLAPGIFINILAAILGYPDMARDDLPKGGQAEKDINRVLKAGNRAKELVSQILTFSHKGQETMGPMLPSPVIKEALKLMRASLPTTIEIQQEINTDTGLIVANPTNIHQVIVNLCTNALHSMEDEKGTLTVSLNQVEVQDDDLVHGKNLSPGPFVKLMVGDTGCGIDQGIVEPYFTTRKVGKGTGLGLALVHGIVRNCGGFVRVESEPGEGTIFHVYFPAINKIVREVKKEEQEALPGGNERILVVDDEQEIVDMYKSALERLGYTVTAHTSSVEALEVFLVSPNDFDLIITDQTMPRLTGADLSKKILQIRSDIAIIICTGYSSVLSEEKVKEIGIRRFITKPVSRRNLACIVREELAKENHKQFNNLKN